jgi:hypothetical protein
MRRRDRDELLRRKEDTRTGRRVLIACEGEKTEPNYFADLKKELRAAGVELEIINGKGGSAPISVVDRAIEKQDEAVREKTAFDHVWCVFDRNGHESFYRALDKAKGNGIQVAASVPSFEVWLLLHFRYSSGALRTGGDAVNALTEHLVNYLKGGSYGAVLTPLRATALRNADMLLKHHVDAANNSFADPWTEVHLLVRLLEGLRIS